MIEALLQGAFFAECDQKFMPILSATLLMEEQPDRKIAEEMMVSNVLFLFIICIPIMYLFIAIPTPAFILNEFSTLTLLFYR